MLSPRELSYAHLPSRIWINEHLTYTHGYGVVVGPVNRITPEGLPEFFVKDIPPQSTGGFPPVPPAQIFFADVLNKYLPGKNRPQEVNYTSRGTHIYPNETRPGGSPL